MAWLPYPLHHQHDLWCRNVGVLLLHALGKTNPPADICCGRYVSARGAQKDHRQASTLAVYVCLGACVQMAIPMSACSYAAASPTVRLRSSPPLQLPWTAVPAARPGLCRCFFAAGAASCLCVLCTSMCSAPWLEGLTKSQLDHCSSGVAVFTSHLCSPAAPAMMAVQGYADEVV